MQKMGDLRTLLRGDTMPARKVLLKHVSEIRMMRQAGSGKPHYVAEGRWNLLGGENAEKEIFVEDATLRKIRVVSGVGFEPYDSLGYESVTCCKEKTSLGNGWQPKRAIWSEKEGLSWGQSGVGVFGRVFAIFCRIDSISCLVESLGGESKRC
jgi:hypothetical protein